MNRSQPWVCKILSLLTLPAKVQSLVESGELGFSKAYEMSGLPHSEMVDFAREAVVNRWTRDVIKAEVNSRYTSMPPADLDGLRPIESMEEEARDSRPRIKPYRLTVRQFERMIDAGVIPERHDVELLAGILVDKMTKYEPHNFALARLGDDLRRLLTEEWVVREEKPVQLGHLWRPEPDLAVVKGPHERYGRQVPLADDIGILIEASDSSYPKDRGSKWVRYAASSVPTYWIINIAARTLETYSDPAGQGRSAHYRVTHVFRPGEDVPIVLGGREMGRIVVRFFVA